MNRAKPHVPEVVRAKAVAVGAAHWLDELPWLIATLERVWSCTVGRVYPAATEAFVADVTLDGGAPAVLKLLIPRAGDHAANEMTVLRLAGGTGCVRLLRDDPARGALLLERLGRWLSESIVAMWEGLDRPCPRQAVEHALACSARRIRAHDDERAVLVHGDVHQWNALRAPTGNGFKLVDPDGLLAEAEYDLGIVMREDAVELMHGDPGDRARWLAARTGLDAVAIWEWGVVERVSTGLLCTSIGLQPAGREMLAAADRIAREYPAGPG